MRLRVVVLTIVAGCNAPPSKAPQVAVEASASVANADAAPIPIASPTLPPAPTVVAGKVGHGPVEAPHAGDIELLAITPDGGAAISCDDAGGVRLWPTLDGTREPRVVDVPEPKALAIGRRSDGFTVVELDDVGGIVVSNVDADGRDRSHATLAGDPAFAGIAMTEVGALAWRSDQTIALLGDDGATKSLLGTEPGQRLVTVGVSGRRAAVVIETSATTRRARWLKLEPQLAWGAWIDDGNALGHELAVSPDGSRIATVVTADGKPPQLEVIATATGKVELSVGTADPVALGFVTDQQLAVATAGGVAWLDVTAKPIVAPVAQQAAVSTGVAIGVGGGHGVVGVNGELSVVTPTGAQYLGYDLESPNVVAVGPDGHLMIALVDVYAMLDRDLHVASAPALSSVRGSSASELLWLAGDDWLVESADPRNNATQLSIVDLAQDKSTPVHGGMGVVPVILHDASTNLVTLSLDDTPEVDRYDRASHKLVRVSGLAKPKTFNQSELVPLSPKLAGGAVLVRVTMSDRLTLQWLDDARALDHAASSVRLDGAFAGADAAGHVFVWRTVDPSTLALVVYTAGKQTATLEHDGSVALWPDPTGTAVVEVGQRSIALYDVTGVRKWTQQLAGGTEALWLTDGTIAIVTAAGIARLDPATGAVLAARCGWRFGLSPKPHPPVARIEPVCEQLAR